ncbi:MAG: hypothetical protein DMG98_24510 [Acidobacteria bacterium]|nr:MAG: hypothetical protein DMG98_24510 [Acidobacteriota bacterium]
MALIQAVVQTAIGVRLRMYEARSMSDIAEQIQASAAVPQFPAAEVPTQPSEPQTPEPECPAPDEAVLTAEITELWRLHADYAASVRDQSQNLRSLRAELAEKLAQMKQVLAQPGRLGKWSGWLKEKGIPRATADRLVTKYERSLSPDPNCLTESISEPTEAEIQSLLDKIAPKLRRVLRTPASAYRLLELLVSALTLDRKDTEEGFVVLRPAQESVVVDSVPAESPVESAPLIPDVLVEGSSESMGTPAVL